jgi:hypothetical protein
MVFEKGSKKVCHEEDIQKEKLLSLKRVKVKV